MQAGKYWVGDLCYVLSEEWDEFCAITMPNGDCLDGEFALSDGRKFAFSRTAYGDGVFSDQFGRQYGVDAGLIGCIRVEDIHNFDSRRESKLGHVVDMKDDFILRGSDEGNDWDGVITIGDVYISTAEEEDYDEEEEEEEDDSDA